ncbi:MAG: hypothetical protein IIB13_00595 [Chloroflexi bacterium]|nr:hypothetical protein [Chloroflexota bacterium]
MPVIRYAQIFKDGQLIDSQPYEVSDEELALENADQVIKRLSAKADNEMTTPEMAQFLKALARAR